MALKKIEIKRGIFPDSKPQPGQELSSQREFTFFAKPRWKKLTEYEKLLLYAQPNPDWIPGGLDWGDWPQRFPGGRDVWGNYFTELRCQDWYAFRDPAKRWQFVYVSEKGDEWRVLRRRLAAYADLELWRSIAPWWRDEILGRVWGAFLHHEYGVFNTLSSVARDALSDVIRTAVSTAAFDKLDNAQMIQMEKLFLAKLMPEGFNADIEHAKNFWLTSPLYAPALNLIEEVWSEVPDHCEVLFAMFMIHDPLYGVCVRNEFMEKTCGIFGDTLTHLFLPDMDRAFRVARDWNFDLFHNILGNDPEFGTYNKKIMQVWLDRWLPKTCEAVRAFQEIYDRRETKAALEHAPLEKITPRLHRVIAKWHDAYIQPLGLKVDIDAVKKLMGV